MKLGIARATISGGGPWTLLSQTLLSQGREHAQDPGRGWPAVEVLRSSSSLSTGVPWKHEDLALHSAGPSDISWWG